MTGNVGLNPRDAAVLIAGEASISAEDLLADVLRRSSIKAPGVFPRFSSPGDGVSIDGDQSSSRFSLIRFLPDWILPLVVPDENVLSLSEGECVAPYSRFRWLKKGVMGVVVEFCTTGFDFTLPIGVSSMSDKGWTGVSTRGARR